jgi:O-antigen/teichoic acid export membrane protein
VSLAFQWISLLALPASSWNNLVLARLKQACDTGEPVLLRAALRRNLLMNTGVTLALAAVVVLASPLIAAIYKVPADTLRPLLLLSGLDAVLFTATSVYELYFFCQGRQTTWMVISAACNVVRCLVTAAGISYSFMMAPVGMAVASSLLLVVAWLTGRCLPAGLSWSERTSAVPDPARL